MMKEKRIAVVPGSYDPVTKGHMDIIARAAKLFDEVRVVVFVNSAKNYCFSAADRLELLSKACADMPNVKVEMSEGLVVDYAIACGACALVKGIRNTTDFDYEYWMASINRSVDEQIETVLLPARAELSYMNSTVVRELLRYGKDVSQYVPEEVAEDVAEMYEG